jgi:mono/diheme cytochrome c family protein
MRIIVAMLVLTALAACSSAPSVGSPTIDTNNTETTPMSLGRMLVEQNDCTECHGADLSGSASGVPGYPKRNAPNLTPDSKTGVGDWTDDQLRTAIRAGIDDDGKVLCAVMPKFGNLADTDVANIIAYLRSLPAVSKDIPHSACPVPAK